MPSSHGPASAALRGQLVELRTLRRGDAAALDVVLRDRGATRWLPPRVRDETGAAFLARVLAEARSGDGRPFAIRPLGSGDVLGQIRLFRWSRTEASAEVGYWIRRSAWGNGYATDGVRVACRYGFRTMRLHRIGARVVAGNDASRRVLEKVGFRFEGIERASVVVANQRRDVWTFGLLRPEWRNARGPSATVGTRRPCPPGRPGEERVGSEAR
jgi:ribosomal-protein-alanine N-acetyltransferase